MQQTDWGSYCGCGSILIIITNTIGGVDFMLQSPCSTPRRTNSTKFSIDERPSVLRRNCEPINSSAGVRETSIEYIPNIYEVHRINTYACPNQLWANRISTHTHTLLHTVIDESQLIKMFERRCGVHMHYVRFREYVNDVVVLDRATVANAAGKIVDQTHVGSRPLISRCRMMVRMIRSESRIGKL